MMKKVLLSLFLLSALPSQIWAKAMFTQDVNLNIYTLATTGKCIGKDLSGLDSAQFKPGALISIQGSFTTIPNSPHPAITDLSGAILQNAVFNCALDGLSLKGVDFGNANLSNATFNSCDLTGAKFNGATLIDTSFIGNTTLVSADFTSANLSGANLSGVNATSAIFTDAPMYGANLSCGNFTSAKFFGAGMSGSSISCNTQPVCDGVSICNGGTNFTNALFYDPSTGKGLVSNITQEDISKDSSGNYVITLDPKKLNLSGMSISNVTFNGANMVGIDLSLGSCTNCYFMGTQTNLSSAVFTGRTFVGSYFTHANLTHANFTDTNFTGNNAFTSANLTGANFTSAGLIGVDFTYAIMRNITIDNAKFNNSKISLTYFTVPSADSVSFDGAQMNNGIYIFGKLTNSSIQNVNLNGSAGYIAQNSNINSTGTNINNSAYLFSVPTNLEFPPYNTLPTTPVSNFPMSYLLQLPGNTLRQVSPPGIAVGPCNEGGGGRCQFKTPAKNDTLTLTFSAIWNSGGLNTTDFCTYMADAGINATTCQNTISTAAASGVVQVSNEVSQIGY